MKTNIYDLAIEAQKIPVLAELKEDVDALSAAESILNHYAEQDRELLASIGIVPNNAEDLKSSIKQKEKTMKFLDERTVFIAADVMHDICKKYDLKILPLKYYKGVYPSRLAESIRKFEKEWIFEGTEHAKKYSFSERFDLEFKEDTRTFVDLNTEKIEGLRDRTDVCIKDEGNLISDYRLIAPSELFHKATIKENSFKKEVIPLDPALVLQVGNSGYLFIDTWGNDFTTFRKIKSFVKRATINTIPVLMNILACTNPFKLIYLLYLHTDDPFYIIHKEHRYTITLNNKTYEDESKSKIFKKAASLDIKELNTPLMSLMWVMYIKPNLFWIIAATIAGLLCI